MFGLLLNIAEYINGLRKNGLRTDQSLHYIYGKLLTNKKD